MTITAREIVGGSIDRIEFPFNPSIPVRGEFLRLPESLRILKSDQHEKTDQVDCAMRVTFLLFVHFLVNAAKLVGPGGSKRLLRAFELASWVLRPTVCGAD